MKIIPILLVFAVLAFGGCSAASTVSQSDLQSNVLQAGTLQLISPSDAMKLISDNKTNPDFVVLDVRTPAEFQSGHIESAVNIDFNSSGFQSDLSKLDVTRTYLVYCRSGHRSGEATTAMKQLGFSSIYNLDGGITNWQASGGAISHS